MKQKWNQFKERQVRVHELDDRLLLLNLYLTQGLTLLAALIWIWLQGRNPFALLVLPEGWQWLWWGAGLAVAVVLIDIAVSQFMPEEMTDDGGMNEKLFGKRPVWHIVVICLIVGICEELLFRGAVQYAFGPYWTSILFAAIHVRYLRHWLPTLMVFLISYALGTVYEWTGTLWAPIAAHFFIDLIMGLILRFRREL
ncbi:CPBP family intramembrane metalloprotease [Paenibacillus thiaminolyticus]|uniref:CPBP family intramembrane metalloprotease n=1 Tax=Paenibacillus thiaminolyticus TaxID=49283 RepID=A0AAP9DS22_PANTH|nr:CPBP family intramembrane glutamic endopeptidase [Paenibacillus thiaminolyticus]MCY9538918.1 CPBP family intramembrane metalloprotease [Paenibacillus thiaminolyticus]MCY9602608.1 CPBP family intramembrane metalloprotease [Paenibacillus thiaminolyticus]MCY9611101.1 CPBP family intramembrane metalloprotease [Paenibacillus thiaminolyticus]MCY9616376.1 CPBP family intramembrane metalloprotease [Paenibacillus thiaminolyticus]MCY9621813.1 CPBP family intramembrane metalloprotease [Paenibacillus t